MLASVEAYLSQLPTGLASYPHAMVKGNVFRDALDELRPRLTPDVLPAELLALVLDPPGLGAWVPEADSVCAWIAMHELFVKEKGQDAFDEMVIAANRRLFSSPLYKALFVVLRPDAMLVGMEFRWRAFRKGTTVRVTDRRAGHARIVLAFPPFLYPLPRLMAFRHAFAVGLEAAGARRTTIAVEPEGSSTAHYSASWS
jgi:hypothetical protein